MPFVLVTLCCAFAGLGSFLVGYDSGVISSSIEQDAFLKRFGSPGSSDAASGGIISSYTGIVHQIFYVDQRFKSNVKHQEVQLSGRYLLPTSPTPMDAERLSSLAHFLPRLVPRFREAR